MMKYFLGKHKCTASHYIIHNLTSTNESMNGWSLGCNMCVYLLKLWVHKFVVDGYVSTQVYFAMVITQTEVQTNNKFKRKTQTSVVAILIIILHRRPIKHILCFSALFGGRLVGECGWVGCGLGWVGVGDRVCCTSWFASRGDGT